MGKRLDALKHAAWSVFDVRNNDDEVPNPFGGIVEESYASNRPDRVRFRVTGERSIITSVYTRMAIDFSSIEFRHARLNAAGHPTEEMDSGLNECLKVSGNIDQAPTHLKRDIAMSLFESGHIAVVPVRTVGGDPLISDSYDIRDLRVGFVTKWRPFHVTVKLYDDRVGKYKEVTIEKRLVALVENPFYSVMNEQNSILQRIIRKLALLDVIDEQSGSGKLDIIIQLPYVIRSDEKRKQAEQRRKDIEFQLQGSKYGVAYADGTEKITQLNRPAENNLMKQIETLLEMLYSQLGITPEIMNGTADEAVMLNYYNRTIMPIVDAVLEEFRRKFLTKTARSQGQTIVRYWNPFKFVSLQQLGEIANHLSRNEIATANEIRPFFGLPPSKDPKADQLLNSNINKQEPAPSEQVNTNQEGDSQNGS